MDVEIWRRRSSSVDERVTDLLGRMSLREKVAQLRSLWLGTDSSGQVAPHQHDFASPSLDWEKLIKDGLGQLTRPYGTVPVEPEAGAQRLAQVQRRVMEAGEFGIPAMVHEECLTGLTAWKATIYPAPLCWGATFDPDLVEEMGAQIGRTMRGLGVHQGLAPVLDVVRDLRWGRVEEAISEDPFLVGTIGSAYVRGLQSEGIVATLKHFVGYSSSRAGRNFAPVSVGPRELADILLPPFEMALRDGARSVMNSYTDIDGVPVGADKSLLSGLLRGSWGFTGTVVSDYYAVGFLQSLHHVAEDLAGAAALALEAGVDVELPNVNAYGDALVSLVESGKLDVSVVDRSVRRVLAQKCEQGLLDPDWSPEPPVLQHEAALLDGAPQRQMARRLAERSIVLLSNDGCLPLRPGLRLGVVGPLASDPRAMLGCYSFPMHVGAHHPELPLGVDVPAVLDALTEDSAGYEVSYAQGCPVVGGRLDEVATGLRDAAQVASGSDICIAVLGDRAGLFGGGTSGEGCDAVDLRLPGHQEELLEALLATGTPVVLVLLVGRPYDISRQADRLAAAVCGFFLGEEGAPALANVLSGRINPSGHLPVSFPAAGGSQPATYLGPPLAQRSEVSSVDPTPIFPFGHGLSFAPPTWVKVERRSGDIWATDGAACLSVALRNDAAVATTEVVQVYLHDPVAEVARPTQQLIAAQRVELAPGDLRSVVFTLHADLTSYVGIDGRRVVDEGEVVLRVGASSRDTRSSLAFRLKGERRYLGFQRVARPEITLYTGEHPEGGIVVGTSREPSVPKP
ncbi:MAG: glycoside hydrolase family 3 N-terminal domain-containing protein [Acidimicrobiales bacterium]